MTVSSRLNSNTDLKCCKESCWNLNSEASNLWASGWNYDQQTHTHHAEKKHKWWTFWFIWTWYCFVDFKFFVTSELWLSIWYFSSYQKKGLSTLVSIAAYLSVEPLWRLGGQNFDRNVRSEKSVQSYQLKVQNFQSTLVRSLILV